MRIRPGERDLQLLAFAGLVLVIGYLDFVTGPNISLTLLYLLTVVGAGWTLGQGRAILVALVAGVVSLIDVTFASGSPEVSAAFIWNAVSRTLVLTIGAIMVAR